MSNRVTLYRINPGSTPSCPGYYIDEEIVGKDVVLASAYDSLREERDALRAAVECADAYELRDDWREVLERHGWSETEMVASVFIRKLRRAALDRSKP